MSVFKPNDVIAKVTDITPEFLAARGLRGLLLDLDNTLIPYGSYEEKETAKMMNWAAALLDSGIKLYLLSNATKKRAAFWLDKLAFEGVGLAGKPNPQAYRKAAASLGLPANQIAMVGDQLFTDVLGGNLSSMHTVLVHPLVNNSLPHTKLARKLERLVLKRYGHEWYF